jgi:hypothetical protein
MAENRPRPQLRGIIMRFLNCLNRCRRFLGFNSSKRRPERLRSRPALEALEDRLVLSAATQTAATLTITADPGSTSSVRSIVMEVDSTDHTKIDVLDAGVVLGKFTISSINKVNVTVAGNDAIKVDDSNGLPFAPGTVISLSGTGVNNSLALLGSKVLSLSGNEIYSAGSSTNPAAISLGTGFGSVVFTFSSSIGSVTDDLIASQLVVEARGQAVSLVGSNGFTETLKGLAGTGGGGNKLTFRGKGSVVLELLRDNGTATLNATAAAIGLTDFGVDVFGKSDKVIIVATPSTVRTSVTIVGAQGDTVNVQGNSGTVTIFGDSTTVVFLGSNFTDSSKSVTSGIDNDVTVVAAEALEILDGANTKTQENVRVTESTISATGLFGNNSVVVHYGDTFLLFETGQLFNTYVVGVSRPGFAFSPGGVSINDDFSSAGLSVRVGLDSTSGLHLSLFNLNAVAGFLSVGAPGGTYNPTAPTAPGGSEDVTFAGGLASTFFYEGFNSVSLV